MCFIKVIKDFNKWKLNKWKNHSQFSIKTIFVKLWQIFLVCNQLFLLNFNMRIFGGLVLPCCHALGSSQDFLVNHVQSQFTDLYSLVVCKLVPRLWTRILSWTEATFSFVNIHLTEGIGKRAVDLVYWWACVAEKPERKMQR